MAILVLNVMITDYFTKPTIMAVVGDRNSGKSLFTYYLLNELKNKYKFNLLTFGLKTSLPGAKIINSLEQLELAKNSLICLDEFCSLFDLEDRKKKRSIERTIRLLNHNNNILVLIGLPENFKKFISSKVEIVFYKRVNIEDFINGSSLKKNLTNYESDKIGTRMLNLDDDEVLVFNGDYKNYKIPYLRKYDSKLSNPPLFVKKNVIKKCDKSVPNFVDKKEILNQFVKSANLNKLEFVNGIR